MDTAKENLLIIKADADFENSIKEVVTSDLRLSLDELQLNIDTGKYPEDITDKALKELRLAGLVEQKRVLKNNNCQIFLKRSRYYRDVELERDKLGVWPNPNTPRYSVCVCNYNMSDTLERALGSVLRQLDPKLYEMVVIDDGSSDDSLKILEILKSKYSHLRYISLPRDSQRKLGETRNISIRAARGEYVLIHIDADDEWEPYLNDLVTLYHKMEAAAGHDFLLAGQQTGIAKRNFLLAYGPYQNVYRYEDRNMMMRLAKERKLLFLDYQVYRTRLKRPTKKKIAKTYMDVCSQLMYEMRQNTPKGPLILRSLLEPVVRHKYSTFKVSLLRAIVVLPVYIASRFKPPIINPITWKELHAYHDANRGNYSEVMARMGGNPDLSFLSPEAQTIYSYSTKLPGFRSSR